MDREQLYSVRIGDGELDYEKYLKTPARLNCEKPYNAHCYSEGEPGAH